MSNEELTTQTTASTESHKKYPQLPAFYQHGNVRYEIANIVDGKIEFKATGGTKTYILDSQRDIGEIIAEGIDQGIFVGDSSIDANPQGTVYRAEFIFELWRAFGAPDPGEITEECADIAGEDSYYRPSVQWFLNKCGSVVSDLYTYRDIEGAITWAEMAYILYVALGVQSKVAWHTINPNNSGVKVTHIINADESGVQRMELRLSMYKKSRWMKSYLREMRTGVSYIPFPLYASFVNMVHEGIKPLGPQASMAGGVPSLVGVSVDDSKADWMLMEVSRIDMNSALIKIRTLVND